ncbi:hypothetical protein [Brachybacterium sp.]|uniref:hypothetical protein n=1 Tax=Brachybacterium sp. TaxID=1891286 RepID=UPI002ED2AABD
MITPDPSSPILAAGPRREVASLIDALRAGQDVPAEANELSDSFLEALGAVLASPAGTAEISLSSPFSSSVHELTLSRTGVLRRSRGLAGTEEIGIHPTTVLPGLLLRLAAVSPVEPLDPAVVLPSTPDGIHGVFDEDPVRRERTWDQLLEEGAALPRARQEELEGSDPRAVRLVRHRPEGERSATVLLLRGRYLVVEDDHVRGTDPTGASRSLMSAMLRPSR